MVEQHSAVLAKIHTCIQEAAPETYARHEFRHPTPASLPGMLMCTDLRDTVLCMIDGEYAAAFIDQSLAIKDGPARSVVMTAVGGTQIRMRKFPTERLSGGKGGERLRVVAQPIAPMLEQASLFEDTQLTIDEMVEMVEATAPYDLYVLWWPDIETGHLGGAALAAVSNIDDPKLVQVYAVEPLPDPVSMPKADPTAAAEPALKPGSAEPESTASTGSEPEPLDDFDRPGGDYQSTAEDDPTLT
ncbi:MAG: hypothetical protein ABI140_03255 [Jatrophihabitantaceae bacterium]